MPEPLRVFISHSTENLEEVRKIKEELEKYGVGSFVAHEDINPSEEWIARIQEELRACDIFLPVVTDEFRSSLWCDHEVGFATTRRDVVVLPVRVDRDPYGFMSKYQAVRLNGAVDGEFAAKLVVAIGKHPRLHVRLKREMISRFASVESYLDARDAFERLAVVSGFTNPEVAAILEAACSNNQIYEYGAARRYMQSLLDATEETGIPTANAIAEWERRLRGG